MSWRLETQSRTGAIDVSDWVRNGFRDKAPELAEYVGPVEIRKSDLAGRGVFAAKAVEAGTPMFVTEAVSVGRAMLPDQADQSRELAQLVMWKGFVEQVLEAVKRCGRTLRLIYALSADEVPETELFRPNSKVRAFLNEKPDVGRILEVLDVNSMTEEAISSKKLGSDDEGCHGVGLWLLASLVNHSCTPNARRLHIGDHMVVFASRDVKAGEEITFAYFDVLLALKKRRALAKAWGFQCGCERCVFEEGACHAEEIEGVVEGGEGDAGKAVVRLEEGLKRWGTKARERGWLRASFWEAFSECYKSEKTMRKLGRRIPAEAVVAESVAEAVGGDERVLKAAVEAVKKNGGGGGVGGFEMERVLKMGRGVYGKVMKKQAMRSFIGVPTYS
ncbi:hypothetical protein QJS04_geneDACA000561 [Acorus gramineus]|uniref:SET domain-containing protein n=1 Tax=Acorus gramineus TaxID=55184 RepID=A0AAV9ATB7_ACOGR|nr:hypothetical protein QJS04_geneDACA000561 [Acorus gramineus]